MDAEQLVTIWLEAIDRCDSARLVEAELRSIRPAPDKFDLVAVGKAAEAMAEGALRIVTPSRALLVVPKGYRSPACKVARRHELWKESEALTLVEGSHPNLDAQSFEAGLRLLDFVRRASRPLLFLISGGASATAEWPLEPHVTAQELAEVQRLLLRHPLPISAVNLVRKHLSAIKGGRLGALAPAGSLALILSDVAPGQIEMVGSGPTVLDRSLPSEAAAVLETIDDALAASVARRLRDESYPRLPAVVDVRNRLVADNDTLLAAAAAAVAERRLRAEMIAPLPDDIGEVVQLLFARSRALDPDQVLIAGGEPAVQLRGEGRGGRCTELALRMVLLALDSNEPIMALFGSSDGVDGTSGLAAATIEPALYRSSRGLKGAIEAALLRSDSASMAGAVGTPVQASATGTNLRDLYLLARR